MGFGSERLSLLQPLQLDEQFLILTRFEATWEVEFSFPSEVCRPELDTAGVPEEIVSKLNDLYAKSDGKGIC